MTAEQTVTNIWDLPPEEFIREVEGGLSTITNNEDLDKYQLSVALRYFVQAANIKTVAEDWFEQYYENGSEEHLELYRRLFYAVNYHNVTDDDYVAPFFNSIPLKLIEASEDEVHPELLKITSNIVIGGIDKPIHEVMPSLVEAHYVNSRLVNYFNGLPSFIEDAKLENTSVSELFNKDIKWLTRNKEVKELEAYEGYDDLEVLPLEAAKTFIRKLEDLINDLEDQDVDKQESAQVVLAFLEQANFNLLTTDLFECLEKTNDIKYFNLIKRVFKCIRWVDCEEDAFDPFIWHKAFNMVNKKADVHTEIFKADVTTELEFDGKKMSIEEYLELAGKVHEMNDMLIGSLFFNAEARHAVETGTATPTEIFAKKIAELK